MHRHSNGSAAISEQKNIFIESNVKNAFQITLKRIASHTAATAPGVIHIFRPAARWQPSGSESPISQNLYGNNERSNKGDDRQSRLNDNMPSAWRR
jgi:hypothetical protein